MRTSVLALLLALSMHSNVAPAQTAEPLPATDVTAEDVQATLKQEIASVMSKRVIYLFKSSRE